MDVAADRGGHGAGGRPCAREVVEHAELGGGEEDLRFLKARDDLEESVHLRSITGRGRRTAAAYNNAVTAARRG